jgi:hypothetical protein
MVRLVRRSSKRELALWQGSVSRLAIANHTVPLGRIWWGALSRHFVPGYLRLSLRDRSAHQLTGSQHSAMDVLPGQREIDLTRNATPSIMHS